jgi:uncharacterized protein
MDNPDRRSRRDTGRTPRKFDQTVPSPCVGICTLDVDELCVGCLRTVDEIRDWMILDRGQKIEVLARIRERHATRDNTKS